MTALDQAILDNEKLVLFTVNKYFPEYRLDDDIIQLGRIGLWKALRSYDPEASKFGNYAVLCIKNEIGKFFQCQNYPKRKEPVMVRLDAPAPMEENHSQATVADVIPGVDDVDFLDVDAILAALTAEQRFILAKLASGYCVAEIARQMGSTKFLIGKQKKRICKAVLKEVTISEEKRRDHPRSRI